MCGSIGSAQAQGSAFIYQGRLNAGGSPASGSYDFQFYLRDALSGGNPVGATNSVSAVGVSNGLFTVSLDFGGAPFGGGAPRWLEIEVRTNGAGGFTTLSPRQPLLAVPYSITASNITGVLPASQLSGAIALAQLPGAVLTNNVSGGQEIGIGTLALANDSGFGNTALGFEALASNNNGINNTAVGYKALQSNTTGIQNTAVGIFALNANTTGNGNTATGDDALGSNTSGNNNSRNFMVGGPFSLFLTVPAT
ncbi:MAG: hypothetical protein C5B50_30230 [Verrucomicrobia bacterium]|nr:MAG: hypothetical protein C5B50_30230 [Verrucomicrobiota bacterium]